jgi:hypothetical protein
MAKEKLTELTEITTVPNTAWIHIVDPTNTDQDSEGSSFKARKINLVRPSNLTDGKVPYTSPSGLVDSPIFTQGTKLFFGEVSDNGSGAIGQFNGTVSASEATSPNHLVNKAQLDLKESKSNKQDSLDVDGSGDKYPTVDTINEALSKIKQDKNFIYNQTNASSVWSITHNLDKKPSVTVVDTADSHVIGQVNYINNNQVTITFKASFSGYAYFN